MAPVHAAAQMGQLECLSWLVSLPSQVDWCPLYDFICFSVQVKNAGVSANEKDNDGATPAHFAAARGMSDTIIGIGGNFRKHYTW